MDSLGSKDGYPPNSDLISELRMLLESLPNSLPLSSLNFRSFVLDPESVEDRGIVGAVNRELEVAFQTHTEGRRFVLTGRGPGIAAIADVLERYLELHATDAILRKWAHDLIECAKLTYTDACKVVCVSGSFYQFHFCLILYLYLSQIPRKSANSTAANNSLKQVSLAATINRKRKVSTLS